MMDQLSQMDSLKAMVNQTVLFNIRAKLEHRLENLKVKNSLEEGLP